MEKRIADFKNKHRRTEMEPSYEPLVSQEALVALFLAFWIAFFILAIGYFVIRAAKATRDRPRRRKGNRYWSPRKRLKMGLDVKIQAWDGTERRGADRRSNKERRETLKAVGKMLSGAFSGVKRLLPDDRGVPSETLDDRPRKTTSLSTNQKVVLKGRQDEVKRIRRLYGPSVEP